MQGKLFGRRFLTRGSTRCGRMGMMINTPHGIPLLGALSHRSASRQLSRSTPRCWRLADGPMTIRTRLSTMATMVSSFSTPGPVFQCSTSLCIVVLSCARAVSTCQRWRDHAARSATRYLSASRSVVTRVIWRVRKPGRPMS
jgi:hypothetical protein